MQFIQKSLCERKDEHTPHMLAYGNVYRLWRMVCTTHRLKDHIVIWQAIYISIYNTQSYRTRRPIEGHECNPWSNNSMWMCVHRWASLRLKNKCRHGYKLKGHFSIVDWYWLCVCTRSCVLRIVFCWYIIYLYINDIHYINVNICGQDHLCQCLKNDTDVNRTQTMDNSPHHSDVVMLSVESINQWSEVCGARSYIFLSTNCVMEKHENH